MRLREEKSSKEVKTTKGMGKKKRKNIEIAM